MVVVLIGGLLSMVVVGVLVYFVLYELLCMLVELFLYCCICMWLFNGVLYCWEF